jgi:hypothetical protein
MAHKHPPGEPMTLGNMLKLGFGFIARNTFYAF